MKGKVYFKGRLKTSVMCPLYLAVVLAVLTIGMYFVNLQAAYALTVFFVIYLVVVICIFRYSKDVIYKELMEFASYYDGLEQKLLNELDIPYTILESDGKIVWMNELFEQLSGKDEKYHRAIAGVFPSLTKEALEKVDEQERFIIEYDDMIFRADVKRLPMLDYQGGEISTETDEEAKSIFVLSLFDETKRFALSKENEEQKLSVALIYVDNYEEVLETVEEIKGSLLTALIDRRISQYFAPKDALIKKFDRDKYFIVFKQKYLENFKENKFHILEETKEVKVGNELAVTLSIGIGARGASYSQNYDFAKTAMDLALGRGGDQVVVKEKEDIFYFGGKARQIEKVTRVKARVKAQALQELMQSKDDVIIMGHHIGDVDSFGASIGIYRAAALLGKRAYIVIEEPNSSIRLMMNLFTPENGYPQNLFVDCDQALDLVDEDTLVMVVDVNRPSYTECPLLLEAGNTIVVFDHHRQGSETIDNAVLSYIEPYASSTCEMVAEVLQYFSEDIKLMESEADCIYAGIIIDTNNFMTKTGVRTFEAAAYLRRAGAEVTRVRKMLQNDMEAYRARAEAVRQAEVYRGVFAISVCPADNLESPTVAGAQAANELLNIIGIKASFVLTQYHDKIYVSSRSIDEINVQIIMEKLGGGGHLNVAGAQLSGYTVDEAKNFIRNTLDDMIEKGDIEL